MLSRAPKPAEGRTTSPLPALPGTPSPRPRMPPGVCHRETLVLPRQERHIDAAPGHLDRDDQDADGADADGHVCQREGPLPMRLGSLGPVRPWDTVVARTVRARGLRSWLVFTSWGVSWRVFTSVGVSWGVFLSCGE